MKISMFVGAAALCAAAGFASAQISQVSYDSLTGTGFETFEGFLGGTAPGTNYDGPVSNASLRFGESFSGQTVSSVGGFDALSGSPTGPLTVATGIPNQNLCIFDNGEGNLLTGLSSTGFPNFDAIGEGSLVFLFTDDQAEFGFQLAGGDGGSAFLNFFRRDGSLVSSIQVDGLSSAYYGFVRDGGVQDIAGVSIHNVDGGGIGLDNLRFTIPAPSMAMMAGIGAWTAMRRRR
jgi:hypothetical protein